ncbi:MAG: glycosyltransferase, partial [Actinomycetota bacterium]
MRVLHFLWSGEVGGAERALSQLVASQATDGSIEPGLALGRGRGPYASRVRLLGVPVIDLGLRGGADFRALTRGSRALRGWDVHHFHSAEPALMAASLRVRGTTRVFTNRGGEVEGDWTAAKRLRHAAAGLMLRWGFHGYSGNTAHAATVAARRYRLDPSLVSVTPNGLDFGLLRPARARAEVRTELGAGPRDVLVGTSGVLKAWKRVDRLLEGVAGASDPRVRAVV